MLLESRAGGTPHVDLAIKDRDCHKAPGRLQGERFERLLGLSSCHSPQNVANRIANVGTNRMSPFPDVKVQPLVEKSVSKSEL